MLKAIQKGDMRPSDFMVLLGIVSESNEEKESSFFYTYISEKIKSSPDTVRSSVKRLVKKGFLEKGKGKRVGVKRQFYRVTTDLVSKKVEKPLTIT